MSDKSPIPLRPFLHAFALLLVVATFILVIAGGNVTSHNAGLAVPDWPTTYGYNMFTFPAAKWVGGIWDEHVHRLIGATVGLLCIVMTAWLWMTHKHRPAVRWLGVGLLLAVTAQGVMGGLRVTEMSVALAIFHGISAQLFLCLTVLIAAATSNWWLAPPPTPNALRATRNYPVARILVLSLFLVLLIQLTLGAALRHTDSGLAIPDFPTSYGHILPPLNQAALAAALNAVPLEQTPCHTPTIAQVHFNFAHRVWALVVLAAVAFTIVRLNRLLPEQPLIKRPLLALMVLLSLQIILGPLVIWTGRQPAIATAHQAVGAALLATAALLTIRVFILTRGTPQAIPIDPTLAPGIPPGIKLEGGMA